MTAGVAKLLIACLYPLLHTLRAGGGAIGAERLAVGNRQHVVLERGLEGAALALDVQRLVHRRLRQLERIRVLQRDALGQLERGPRQLFA